MRLLIATDTNSPRLDGVSRFLIGLENHLKGMRVKIIAPNFGIPRNKFSVERVRLLHIRFGDFYFSLPSYKRVKQLVRQSDVVFVQSIGPIGAFAILAAKKMNKPVVLYSHVIDWVLASSAVKRCKSFVRIVIKLVSSWLYKKCSRIIVASSRNADTITKLGVKTPKTIIPLGVDTQYFKPANKVRAKRLLGLQGKRVVGFTGRLALEKDLPTLYKAFKDVQKRLPNVKLLVVGTGLANIIPADPDVVMAGPQEYIVPYLQAMDVFVLPSLTETNSLATMEAMACGIPVVVTPVGSVGDYVREGENGFFFSRGDVSTLSKHLLELLTSPSMRVRIGEEARKTIVRQRQFDYTAKKVVQVLRNVKP